MRGKRGMGKGKYAKNKRGMRRERQVTNGEEEGEVERYKKKRKKEGEVVK